MSKKLVQSEEFSPIFNRLIAICDSKKYSVSNLLDKFATSRSAINAWKKGNISAGTTAEIAKALGVSIEYLITGQEKNSSAIDLTADERELLDIYNSLSTMSKGRLKERAAVLAEFENLTADDMVVEEAPEERHLKINCSTYQVSAGAGFELGEGDEWYEIEVPDTSKARKADFALQIKGNSMEPIYFNGDIVLVKEQPSVELGEIGIFNIEGNGYIKKFGGDRLISLNAEYDDIEFSDYDEERIRCFGKVIGRV